jgi:hypothetical protein
VTGGDTHEQRDSHAERIPHPTHELKLGPVEVGYSDDDSPERDRYLRPLSTAVENPIDQAVILRRRDLLSTS